MRRPGTQRRGARQAGARHDGARHDGARHRGHAGAAVIACLLLAPLTGCGGTADDTTAAGVTPPTAVDQTITTSQPATASQATAGQAAVAGTPAAGTAEGSAAGATAGTGRHGNAAALAAPTTPAVAARDAAPRPGPGPTVGGVTVAGVWQGSYVCRQGRTGLRLTITATGGDGLAAAFDFYPLPENPSVPRGSFTMVGSARGSEITLDGHEWVSRPPGYEMVNLTGTPGAGTPDRIGGGFRGVAGCTGFSVQRAPTTAG